MSAGTPARRGAADLPLGWASQAAVERLGTALGGTSVRATALQAFDTLPTESNLLFTGYVDLRAADLEAASLLLPPAAIGDLPAGELPDGAAALIHISSRGVRVHLGTEARAVGLTVTPLAGERPLAGAASDRLTALVGACWNLGIVCSLPSGRLSAPIVIRVESQIGRAHV